jgi:dihydroorotase (multifunctional complex type)
LRNLFINCGIAGGKAANILVAGNRIAYIGEEFPDSDEQYDMSGMDVFPGMIDPHVHVRDMNLAEKETWETASKAALAGGVTTIMDMPNTDPATIDQYGLEKKREAAGKSLANYGFHFGGNLENYGEILKAKNIAGVKVFLAHSSSFFEIPEEKHLYRYCEIAGELEIPLLVHSECQNCLDSYASKFEPVMRNHNKLRDPECAALSTGRILKIAGEVGNKLYLAHLSTAEEINLVKKARDRGVRVYAEATPHHLLLDESVIERWGNFAKVNPPIRCAEDRDALWKALIDGTIDTIGTDHAPHRKEEKLKEYNSAPSGFPGLETAVPLLLNAVYEGKLSVNRYMELTSVNSAEIFRLKDRGGLEVGKKADFYFVREGNYTIDVEKFFSKAGYSPFQNAKTAVKVIITVVNGNIVYNNGEFNEIRGNEIEYS